MWRQVSNSEQSVLEDYNRASYGNVHERKWGKNHMNYLVAGTAVTREAGSMAEMLPKFGVIALAVAIVIIALIIYSKYDKKNK